MARRNRREKRTFRYECTITGKSYKRTTAAQSPDDLMSVEAYYEMNPENDDRPAIVKKKLGIEEEKES